MKGRIASKGFIFQQAEADAYLLLRMGLNCNIFFRVYPPMFQVVEV